MFQVCFVVIAEEFLSLSALQYLHIDYICTFVYGGHRVLTLVLYLSKLVCLAFDIPLFLSASSGCACFRREIGIFFLFFQSSSFLVHNATTCESLLNTSSSPNISRAAEVVTHIISTTSSSSHDLRKPLLSSAVSPHTSWNPTIVCEELFHDFQLEILLGSRNLNRGDCNSWPEPKCEKG